MGTISNALMKSKNGIEPGHNKIQIPSGLTAMFVCSGCGRSRKIDIFELINRDIQKINYRCHNCNRIYPVTVEKKMFKRKDILLRKIA